MKELFLSWGMLVLSVVFNAGGVFILKHKLNELGAMSLQSFRAVWDYMVLVIKAPLVLGGLILFFLAPFLFTVALSRMDISIAYPVQIGLNFLILLLLSVFFLGEALTVYKVIGILFVGLGIYILSRI